MSDSAWQRRTERLQARLARASAAAASTRAEWQEKIAVADQRVADAMEALDGARGLVIELDRAIADVQSELAELRAQHQDASSQVPTYEDALAAAEAAHEEAVGAPTRKLETLARAEERVRYRLQLHRARRPLTALTGGVEGSNDHASVPR